MSIKSQNPAFQIKQQLKIYSFIPHFILTYAINMCTESNAMLKISEYPFIVLSSDLASRGNVQILHNKPGKCFNFECITLNYLEFTSVKWDPAH